MYAPTCDTVFGGKKKIKIKSRMEVGSATQDVACDVGPADMATEGIHWA